MKDMGIAATRQLAKRQLTWLRGMTGLQEFDCLAENLSQQVIAYLQTMNLATNN
jgi:tRNA dimethylallyltransferase